MKAKTVFFCSECGYENPKWMGKCPGCGSFGTMTEAPTNAQVKASGYTSQKRNEPPRRLSEIEETNEMRFSTGMGEFDRVLGGGAVHGSLVLLGGEPGIGKSTLLLQICGYLSESYKILYVTGEESLRQLKLRANRLGISADCLYVLAETQLERVCASAEDISPDVIIVDSIQTMYKDGVNASPGNITQVKECTMALMALAKSTGVTVFVIGHVNKEGAIAGPKVLEHMVDSVLYFEGDRHMSYRLLRAAKNRFGSTNEIGVFEMGAWGLSEVLNPSEMLLSGRPEAASGSCVACVVEGSRPVLAEIQALITNSSFGTPRRMTAGIDYNRAMLLMAVLEKRGGIIVGASDAYINVAGGFRLDEPAVDLPVLLAVASSFMDKPLNKGMVAFGEVGLSGELRSVSSSAQRINEAYRLGFTSCIIPYQGSQDLNPPKGIELYRVKNIREAISVAVLDR